MGNMYSPIKDGIEKSFASVVYTEVYPPKELRDLVHCYWELKTITDLPIDFRYHVIPDACVNVLFDQNDSSISAITALDTKAKTLNLGKKFHFVGIQLLPGVWRGPSDEIKKDLVDKSYTGKIPLLDYNLQLKGLEFYQQQVVFSEIIRSLLQFDLIAPNKVMMMILHNLSAINSVQEMAIATTLSTRQLQRIIKESTGLSPHDFLKVLRIQLSFQNNYLDYYFDQSHFIHSFRKIVGYTPNKYKEKFNV